MKKFRALPRIVRAFITIVVFLVLPMVFMFWVIDEYLTFEPATTIMVSFLAIVLAMLSFQVYVSTDEELFDKHSLLRFNLFDRLIIVGAELVGYLTGIWIVVQDFEPKWLKYLLIIPAALVLYIVYFVLIYLFGSDALKKEKLEGSFLFRKAGRIAHDPVIKPPLFLCDSYGIHPYESLESAERYFKPKFVAGDEILYDSEGRSLRMEEHNHRVVFQANEAYYPEHSETLEEALRNFLAQRGMPEDRLEDASLEELVDETMKFGIRSSPA